MIIKLHTTQISMYWDVIKYGTAKVANLNPDNYEAYFNELLIDLLTDKSQCFISLDSERNLLWICITKISLDLITGEKYIYLQCLYGFKAEALETWGTVFDLTKEFAIKNECKYILFDSSTERILQMSDYVGFKLRHKTMVYNLGGV